MKRFEFSYCGKTVWKTPDQVVSAASEDLKKEDYIDRRFAIAALSQLSTLPAAQAAAAEIALALADTDAGVRYWAAVALNGLGSGMVHHHAEVAAALKDQDSGVRCYAAAAMVKIGEESDYGKEYFDDLVEATSDSDPQVRIEATRALVAVAREDELEDVAASHVTALQEDGSRCFVQALLNLLASWGVLV
jgi:HEAT repeat protein